MKRSPIKRKPRKKQPGDDPKYKQWIQTLPCVICYKNWPLAQRAALVVEAAEPKSNISEHAHVGVRGLKQLCPDRESLPFCRTHHREGKYAHHVLGKKFWDFHQIDRDSLVSALKNLYGL